MRELHPTGANLRRNSAANSSPPPWGGGGGGGGLARGGTPLPQPPDPPPQPSPTRGEGVAAARPQLRLAPTGGKLSVEGIFESSRATYTYGTAAVHVAVDPRTGHVEILDYLVVDDVGRIVNPLTLHGQVIGAAVQGCGSVFGEHLAYDAQGQLLVASLADYLVPLATDYPNLRAITLEEYPSPNNPLGVKGAGEGGIIPVGGAVANAVAAALSAFGVEPRELPLSPPALWRLIELGRQRGSSAFR